MYLIKFHGFDWMENSLANARYVDIVGYSETEDEANLYISSQKLVQKKEWDGNNYPYYTIVKVDKIVVNN